jgi:hypothetical protein
MNNTTAPECGQRPKSNVRGCSAQDRENRPPLDHQRQGLLKRFPLTLLPLRPWDFMASANPLFEAPCCCGDDRPQDGPRRDGHPTFHGLSDSGPQYDVVTCTFPERDGTITCRPPMSRHCSLLAKRLTCLDVRLLVSCSALSGGQTFRADVCIAAPRDFVLAKQVSATVSALRHQKRLYSNEERAVSGPAHGRRAPESLRAARCPSRVAS